MSREINTSTQEGWEAVVKHALDGGEVEYGSYSKISVIDKSIVWKDCTSHPCEWHPNGYTYRIKSQREPQIGDFYKDKRDKTIAIDFGIFWVFFNKDEHSTCLISDWAPTEFYEYKGSLDLSALMRDDAERGE